MSSDVYRSVKVVVQDNSLESLVLTGFSAIKGEWLESPSEGDTVPANGSLSWSNLSKEPNLGCAGYLTLICSAGYVIVSWELPWIGPLSYRVSFPDEYRVDVRCYEEDPAQPAIVFNVWDELQGGKHAQRTTQNNLVTSDDKPALPSGTA